MKAMRAVFVDTAGSEERLNIAKQDALLVYSLRNAIKPASLDFYERQWSNMKSRSMKRSGAGGINHCVCVLMVESNESVAA